MPTTVESMAAHPFLARPVILLDHVFEIHDHDHLNRDPATEGLRHSVYGVDPAGLAPLRSVTILGGNPFTSKALAKTRVAAFLFIVWGQAGFGRGG